MTVDKVKALDASWLHFETTNMPMHIASAPIFKLPRGKAKTFYKDLKEHVASRAHLLKTYRVKRKNTPLNLDHPVWVEADDIDLDYHVQRYVLPKPGTMEQWEHAVAKIHERPLDMDRPLWQYTLIEGLEGNRVGLVIKIHHSVIDGESGVAQLDVMFDKTRRPRKIKPPKTIEHPEEPSALELMTDAAGRFINQPLELARRLPSFATAARRVAGMTFDRKRVTPFGARAPRTVFNRSITKSRIFSVASFPLAEIKAIKKNAGVTLNDVVMAMCGGALRKFLLSLDDLSDRSLIAAVPVSLRRGEDAGSTEMGTLVTMMNCPLGTHIEDPIERLAFVNKGSIEAKGDVEATKDAMIQNFNILGAPLAMRWGAQVYGALQLANMHRPIANLIISNIAGPRHEIFLNGAKMEHYHPVSAIAHGQGLNITVQSYIDTLDFGLVACKDVLPGLHVLRDDLVESFQELRTAFLEHDEVVENADPALALPADPPLHEADVFKRVVAAAAE